MIRTLVTFFCLSAIASAQQPGWSKVNQEALGILTGLIRLDTSQPAGNEIIAARYVKKLLDAEGIPSETFESAPGRASIVARVKGNGGKRPLLLLGHLDVVAVERENWSFDPFSGTVKDGKIFGRGSADDKGVVAGSLQVLLLLKRLNVKLDRDVIFLGVADEEHGGDLGITFMLREHPETIDAQFAINEGGGGVFDPKSGEYRQFQIGTAEKTPRRARLLARGHAGHGSVPTKDNAIGVLARAVARLFDTPLPPRLNETTRTYFERLAKSSPPAEAAIYRAILEPNPSEEAQEQLRKLNPRYYSMIRTSVVPTIFQGGYQRNVIPSEAEATLDIRALPDEDPEQLFSTLKKIINEPAVDVVPMRVTRPAHQPAPIDGAVFQSFEKILGKVYPTAVVLPSMSTGASDSAQLRAAGVPSYGFGPGRAAGEPSGAHGNDESLSLSAYHDYIRILWGVVIDLAASR